MRISHPVKTFRISAEVFQELENFKKSLNVVSWNHFFIEIINVLKMGDDLRKVQQSNSYKKKERWVIYGDKNKCFECGATNKQLDRHHWLGYSGENAYKVRMLCKVCHGRAFHE